MINFIIDIIDYFNLDRNFIGNIILFLHATISITYTLLLFIITFRPLLWLMIIPLFFQTLFFIVFRGCIVSKLERKLTKDNYTIVDPILNIFDIETHNKNRNNVTLGFMIILWMILLYKIKK